MEIHFLVRMVCLVYFIRAVVFVFEAEARVMVMAGYIFSFPGKYAKFIVAIVSSFPQTGIGQKVIRPTCFYQACGAVASENLIRGYDYEKFQTSDGL